MRGVVAIKSAQLSQVSRKFDSLPQFQQAGLYYTSTFESIRNYSFDNKKHEGTELFNKGDLSKSSF